MRKKLKPWSLLVLVYLPGYLQAQSVLYVPITGKLEPVGQLLYSLYASPDGFPDQPKKAYRIGSLAVKHAGVTLTIGSLPAGVYALAVVHDVNGNGRLDKNKLGIPIEPIGFSNNVLGAFGPPKFHRAQFNVTGSKCVLPAIRLRMGQ